MYTEKDNILDRAGLADELLMGCRRTCGTPRRSEGCSECEQAPMPCPAARTFGLEGYPLAMVYSPVQKFGELYCMEDGFSRGTIFKELDLPFLAYEEKGGCCRGK